MSQAMSFPSQVPNPSSYLASILETALNEYRKNTGQDLIAHPLSDELQRCDSVDGILAILQRQAESLGRLRDGNQGIMKWVRSSVNILCSISATLGDGAGLVRPLKRTCGYWRTFLMFSSGVPTRETSLYWHWHSPRCPYLAVPFCAHFNTEI
jgi:hypothetical protein